MILLKGIVIDTNSNIYIACKTDSANNEKIELLKYSFDGTLQWSSEYKIADSSRIENKNYSYQVINYML